MKSTYSYVRNEIVVQCKSLLQVPTLALNVRRVSGKKSRIKHVHPSKRDTKEVILERPDVSTSFGLDLKVLKDTDLFGHGSVVTVKTLKPDSIAAHAGLHTGDQVIEIDGVKLATCHPAHVLKKFSGTRVVLTIRAPAMESPMVAPGAPPPKPREVETGDCSIC